MNREINRGSVVLQAIEKPVQVTFWHSGSLCRHNAKGIMTMTCE